jgi:hypothetical protein
MTRLRSLAGAFAIVAVVVISGFLVVELVRKADAAVAHREAVAATGDASPPPTAAWRQELYFDRSKPPAHALGEGWSTPESGSGVWSNAPAATLRLHPPPYPGGVAVALAVEPFVIPARPFQRVRVRVGGRALGEWRLTTAEVTTLQVQVPADLRGPAGELQLQLELPDAASPAKLMKGVLDPRLLAIRLHRVAVTG